MMANPGIHEKKTKKEYNKVRKTAPNNFYF